MKNEKKYYLGLDVGTDSVGWCLTDQNYNIIKKGGKSLWGVRLFNEGQTAKKRREHRSQRRRIDRQRQRLDLLQDLFANEINKVDATFFQRLNESSFHYEDREANRENQYTLFIKKEYTDRDYFKQYPTIFHLREHLLTSDKKEDIRLIYLACHNILKHRGNFLESNFDPSKPLDEEEVETLFSHLHDVASDLSSENEPTFNYSGKTSKINKAFSEARNTTQLMENLNLILSGSEKPNKSILYDVYIPLIAGRKKTFKDLLSYLDSEEEIDDEDLKKTLELDNVDFDTTISDLKTRYSPFEDELDAVIDCYNIRNMFVLSKFLGAGNPYISVAMVNQYNENKNDLASLKKYVKLNLSKKDYYDIFRNPEIENNYVHYIGYTSNRGVTKTVKKCSQQNFYSFLNSCLNLSNKVEVEQDSFKKMVKEKIDNNTYLLKLRNSTNGKYPYQLNELELKTILDNQSKYYPFLNESDGNTNYPTVKDKIISLLTFKIPYYVGPLYTNDNEDDERTKNSWVVKTDKSSILPWTFDSVVDKDKTAEEFIRRMQNKCTYLKGQDDYCLPNKSITFSYFNLLNFLNKVYVNGSPMTKSDRDRIIKELYLNNKKVTIKKIKDWYKKNYSSADDAKITTSNLKDFDTDPDANMSSFVDLKRIFGYDDNKMKEKIDDLEKLIKDITIFEDKDILERKLKNSKNEYPSLEITEERRKSIKGLNYIGWARLSKRLLTGVKSSNGYSILSAMEDFSMNFMETLNSDRFDFLKQIDNYNKEADYDPSKMDIDTYISGLYANSAVKRSLKQTYLIIEEVERIIGHKIDKYFIEFTRYEGEKNRTKSRKDKTLDLYKQIKNDHQEIVASLDSEIDLRDDKLYLYYLQLGRCLYSGESIDLTRLSQDYEIDHIVPWSIENNDSFDNKVLVKKECNQEKTNIYPLDKSRLWVNQGGYKEAEKYWSYLKDKNLISNEKYRRLTRKEELQESDLDNFINRQLVETNQSVKALSDMLIEYLHVDGQNQIVYSKANNVSYYRKTFDIYKSRTANNFHHAHDAFLNVVIGDITDRYFKNKHIHDLYDEDNLLTTNIQKVLKKDYVSSINGEIIYDKDEICNLVNKTIYNRFDILTTTRTFETKTLLRKENLVRKGEASYPVKNSGPYPNLHSYGGFYDPSYAFYTLIKVGGKRKEKVSLIPIPTFYKDNIKGYLKEHKKISEFEILLEKVKTNNMIVQGKTKFCITGCSGNEYELINLKERIFSKEEIKTTHDIDKLLGMFKKSNISITPKLFDISLAKTESEQEKISNQLSKLEKQFSYKINTNQKEIVISPKIKELNQPGITLTSKQIESMYSKIYQLFLKTDVNGTKEYDFSNISSIGAKLKDCENEFKNLDLLKQIYTTSQLLNLLQCNNRLSANLEFIGLAKNSGIITVSQTMPEHFKIIAESPTGYYTKVLYEQ